MDLTPWNVEFKPGWDKHFSNFDKHVRGMIIKKLDQMEQPIVGRGLRSSVYRVEEVGQYRIAFEQDEKSRTKFVHFVGNHKQYARWYKSLSKLK
ncbi:hypothetical protein HZC09_01840 [Candidatus Micrarchaeota archaeon]|nr:hypothetical protein [Candidatus Micrarchaeota archaeon]